MRTTMHIKASITPWDDPAFVKAFEAARDLVHEKDDAIDGTLAGAKVQHLLREAGYPRCAGRGGPVRG